MLGLVLACLVDLAALLQGGVVRLPLDFRVWWECEDALHCFPGFTLAHACSFHNEEGYYLILRTLPLSSRVQMLKMSSPFRTLKTAPQTSSLVSANWSPMIAKTRSSQYRSATPFFNRTIHLPPFLLSSSSQIGLMPLLKM